MTTDANRKPTLEDLHNLNEALTYLLGDTRVGDPTTDLVNAAKETMWRREANSIAGGTVLGALSHIISFRRIEELTEIPKSTAQAWAVPPKRITMTDES